MDKYTKKLSFDFQTNQKVLNLISQIDLYKGKWNILERQGTITKKNNKMKRLLILIIALQVQSILLAQNQEKITTNFAMYQVDLWLKGTTDLTSGILFSVNDSTMTISDSSSKYDYKTGNYTTTVYRLDQIWEVHSHKIRGGGIGVVAGLAGGGLIGGLVGKSKESKVNYYPKKTRKAIKYGAIGGLIGGALGLIIGHQGVKGAPTPNSKVLRKLKEHAIKG